MEEKNAGDKKSQTTGSGVLTIARQPEGMATLEPQSHESAKWIYGVEFGATRPPFKDDDEASIHTNYSDYDPRKHNPVFFQNGLMHSRVSVDGMDLEDFDPAKYHPSIVGHAFLEKPPPETPKAPPPPPNPKTCSPRDYLEHYIFPVLLPALDETLRQAKENKCFERKRTKFDALDFLTEYLYNHNKAKSDREQTDFAEIPFVKEHWKDHPRPPLPKSLLWTEEEATLKIQAFWQGYKVRRDPEVSELRQWQKDWREENENIRKKVDTFWEQKMPEEKRSRPPSNLSKPGSRRNSANSKKAESPQSQSQNQLPDSPKASK